MTGKQASAGKTNPKEKLISTEQITVQKDRISFVIKLSPQLPHETDALWTQYSLATYPELTHHSCVNDFGDTFGATISHTPIPHLLEHIIITEQVRMADPSDNTPLMGTTRWVNRDQKIARIDVRFTSDIVALEAFHNALNFLETFAQQNYNHA